MLLASNAPPGYVLTQTSHPARILRFCTNNWNGENGHVRNGMRQWVKNNGLVLTVFGIFVLAFVGQSLTGLRAYNQD